MRYCVTLKHSKKPRCSGMTLPVQLVCSFRVFSNWHLHLESSLRLAMMYAKLYQQKCSKTWQTVVFWLLFWRLCVRFQTALLQLSVPVSMWTGTAWEEVCGACDKTLTRLKHLKAPPWWIFVLYMDKVEVPGFLLESRIPPYSWPLGFSREDHAGECHNWRHRVLTS